MQVNGTDNLISTQNVGERYCFGLGYVIPTVSYVMCDLGWAERVSVSSRTLESECSVTDRRVAVAVTVTVTVTAGVGENDGCSARVFLTYHVPFMK
jgi:hypothetical protein